jgi:hypothetical protein
MEIRESALSRLPRAGNRHFVDFAAGSGVPKSRACKFNGGPVIRAIVET